MGSTNRRSYLWLGVACAVLAAAVAVGAVLAFGSGSSKAAPTKSEYFARVAAICRFYGPKLDKIPPPYDVTIPALITRSVTKVEPLQRAIQLKPDLASAHNIDVVFLGPEGDPFARVWQTRLGSTAAIRRRQIEAAEGPEGLALVRG